MADASGLTMKHLIAGSSQLADSFGRGIFGNEKMDQIDRMNAMARKQIELTKELREEEERRKQALQEMISTAQHEMESSVNALASRGKSLADSLRTPAEVLRDAWVELAQLRDAGFISEETMTRGLKRTMDEFKKAASEAKAIENQSKLSGAAERGTAGGFSTLVRGQMQNLAIEQALREQGRIERDQLMQMKRIENAVRDSRSHFKVGHLPP
jgi:uncharacterized protein YnzC (UPF0291/DUF896 family)